MGAPKDQIKLMPVLTKEGVLCTRTTGSEESIGYLRPARFGSNKQIRLSQVEGEPLTYDVQPVVAAEEPSSGPAQVATDEYRDGWARIWGKSEVGQA
jgi:hypothetical protein